MRTKTPHGVQRSQRARSRQSGCGRRKNLQLEAKGLHWKGKVKTPNTRSAMNHGPQRAKVSPMSRRRFTSNELLVIIGVLAVVASLGIIFFKRREEQYQKARLTSCKSSLKQLSLVLQSYYSDGTSTVFGSAVTNRRIDASLGGFGFDANMLSCRAKRTHGSEDGYVFDKNSGNLNTFVFPSGQETPFTSRDTWAVVNNPNSGLVHDKDTQHKVNGKTNVACGDGHVEQK